MITEATTLAAGQATAAGADDTTLGMGVLILLGLLYLGRHAVKAWLKARAKKAANKLLHRLISLRAILAPTYAGLAYLVTIVILRLTAPDLWVWPVLVGFLVGLALAWPHRMTQVRGPVTLLMTTLLGAYGSLAVRDGIDLTGLAWGLVLVVAASLPSWVGAARSGEARLRLRLEGDRWREMVTARGMAGLKRGRVSRSAAGLDVMVHLNGGMDLDKLQRSVKQLETGLGVRRGGIRIEAHEMANKAKVRILTSNPLAKPRLWQGLGGGAVSVKDPVEFATTPFGERIAINLRQRILIAGTTGSGKSSVQRLLACVPGAAFDGRLITFDMKGGAEGQHYEHLGEVVTTVEQAERRLIELRDEGKRRSGILRTSGRSTWEPTAADPDLFLQVDEGSELIRNLSDEGLDALFTIAEQGRALGIHLWWATQYPKSENLPTQISSQMTCTIALKMRRQRESNVVFGEGAHTEGWTAHRLRAKGYLLVRDDDHQEPEECRADWMDERELKKVKPYLPPVATVPGPRLTLVKPSADDVDVNGDGAELVDDEYGQDDEITVPAGPAAYPPPVPAPEPMTPAEQVAAALEDADPAAGASVDDVVTATGLGKSTVYRLIKAAVDEGTAAKVGHGRYAAAQVPAETTTG